MNRITAMVFVGVAGLAFVMGQSVAPKSASATEAGQPESDVQALIAAGAPGKHHAELESLIGTWDGTMSFRPAPEVPALEFPGVATREWALGGRFVREVVEAASPFGMPFEGIGYTGYNNIDQRYEMIWMDNMSTAVYPGHGAYNRETKVFTFYSERRDPASGRLITGWSETDVSDPDRHVVKGWEHTADGRVFQSVEGVFTRRR